MLEVTPIRSLKDNYIWACVNKALGEVVIVDPGTAEPVFQFLGTNQLKLVGILVTHKHADHTGGIEALLARYPGVAVYAHSLENIPSTTHYVDDNEIIFINHWPTPFTVIHIPGHTLGHVAYYAVPILLTGDTLFGAGCGRLFEGTADQMFSSLNKLSALPDDTLIYCGHEYTMANLQFASRVMNKNSDVMKRIKDTESLISHYQPSLPSTLQLEKTTNPFLRCTQNEVISSVEHYAEKKLTNAVDVFRELRKWKDNF